MVQNLCESVLQPPKADLRAMQVMQPRHTALLVLQTSNTCSSTSNTSNTWRHGRDTSISNSNNSYNSSSTINTINIINRTDRPLTSNQQVTKKQLHWITQQRIPIHLSILQHKTKTLFQMKQNYIMSWSSQDGSR